MIDRFGFRREIVKEVHGDVTFLVGKIYLRPHDEDSFSNIYLLDTIPRVNESMSLAIDNDAQWLAKRYNVSPK